MVALSMIGAVTVFAENKIEVAVAKMGHDTPHHKATTEVYDKLAGCCKYDRTDEVEDPQVEHKH
ncbi:MAG TPA: hypothetical protein VLA03_05635 [Draconibacterium sp.]|nr:hypothetical protein [Draconibacterium sp.]